MELSENYHYWNFNDNIQEKGVYINIINKNIIENNSNIYQDAWNKLPDIILEQIYEYLTRRERYYASLACKNWYRAFKLPKVWSTFVLDDTTLTRGKFNYYSGWQYVLDHIRASTCFNKIGRNFKTLILEPTNNFQQLYQFMSMMSWYAERHLGCDFSSDIDNAVGTNVRCLKFKFPCNMASDNKRGEIKIFGTGGEILAALKRLAACFLNLKILEFVDLMLDSKEALVLLDEICINCTETLRKLVLINATKFYCPLIHIGVFINLNVLIVSPQNIDADVLDLIGCTKLEHLHIFQNIYSPVASDIVKLPKNNSWIKLRKNNPTLKVHLEIESNKTETKLPIEFPGHSMIPCYSIVLNNPFDRVSTSILLGQSIIFYPNIQVFAIKGLSKYYQDRNSSKRCDENILQLCQSSPNIHTLMIRDKISTSTILEIASTTKSLKCLYVRRNYVLKKFDKLWKNITTDTSEQHEQWIKINSSSYEKTECEVSKILGYRWNMLSEKEFINQKINLHV